MRVVPCAAGACFLLALAGVAGAAQPAPVAELPASPPAPIATVAPAQVPRDGATASDAERACAAEVAREGGPDEARVLAVLAGAKVQSSILEAIARPAEKTRAWKEYRPIFLTPARIDDGIDFYRENRALLDRVGAEYGVPPEVIVAILGVETSHAPASSVAS